MGSEHLARNFAARFSLFFILFLVSGQTDAVIVKTSKGRILGSTSRVDVEGRERSINSFLGIPYGRVPRRFSAPVEVSPWPNFYKTQEQGPSCFHQDDTTFPGFRGAEMWNAPNRKSEDCLYLNVWSPTTNGRTSFPVMVWIYGGSFFSGTAALKVYDGRYLAAFGQVIVVSMNYRLGPLGFMPSLGDDAPGNVGLLDQKLALEWVKENIDSFRGDPQSITLFGESAGAASIGLHMVSPLSRGLFQRVILQSASQTADWATISPEESLSRAKKVGRGLNCPTASKSSLLQCLREKTAKQIFDASWITMNVFDFPFVPVHETEFIPEDPKRMTQQGDIAEVDVLAGFNTNEGVYFALYSIPGFSRNTTSLISERQFLNGIELSGANLNELGISAATFTYKDWKTPSNPAQYRDAIDEIIGDYHISCPVINAVRLHSAVVPSKNSFLYHFSYRISNNDWPEWMGVMHGYEIELVFGMPFLYKQEYNHKDRVMSNKILNYWVKFAKQGEPTNGNSGERWHKYDPAEGNYMEITASFDTPIPYSPLGFRCAFWENYLPSLKLASSGVDELRARWVNGFSRWSNSMDAWENARARRNNEQCRNK